MEQIVVEDAEGNPTPFYPGKSSKVQTALATAPLRTNPSSRIYTTVALLAADISAWFVSVVIMFAVRTLIWGVSPLFWGLWVCGAAWLLFRWASGLYPPTGLSQPDILRRSFRTTAAGAAVHLAILIAAGEDQGWRLIGLAIWLPVVPIAYFCRAAAYLMLRRSHLLGEPCVVIGTGEMARSAIREMQANSELGIIPIAIFSGSLEARISALEGVPVVGTLSDALEYPLSPSVQRAVIAVGRHEADLDASEVATKLARRFPLIQVLSELHTQASLLAAARSLGPYLVLEIRYGRFAAREKTIKRLFDLAIAVPVFLAALPIIGIAALLVKWASPGPAFFSQNREGLNGRQVRIWKIRTMVPDAEKRLAEYLAANPAARFEYERTLKLRQDPRVIPKIGSFLRRTSIDELPQLWSIVKGDMSLVGPRIMPVQEVDRYSTTGRELRRDVPPGLTGLWQVMHRNNSDLHIREVADSYYVNNWSVWLDGWILLRTVRVVLGGSGAF